MKRKPLATILIFCIVLILFIPTTSPPLLQRTFFKNEKNSTVFSKQDKSLICYKDVHIYNEHLEYVISTSYIADTSKHQLNCSLFTDFFNIYYRYVTNFLVTNKNIFQESFIDTNSYQLKTMMAQVATDLTATTFFLLFLTPTYNFFFHQKQTQSLLNPFIEIRVNYLKELSTMFISLVDPNSSSRFSALDNPELHHNNYGFSNNNNNNKIKN